MSVKQDRVGDGHDLMQRYGIDIPTLERMYLDWKDGGVPKSVVEARYLRTRRNHGKLFSKLVRTYLGIETQAKSAAAQRVEELEAEIEVLRNLLTENGVPLPDIAPDPGGADDD